MKKVNNKQSENQTDKLKKTKWMEIINLILAMCAIVISLFTHAENMGLQKQYNRMNTYAMSLNYKIKLLNQTKEGDVFLENNKIKINTPSHMGILPKIGGIEKFYVVHYNNDNLIEEIPIDMTEEETINILDAQKANMNLENII